MVILSVAAFMAKILSSSALLTREAIAWIHTGRSQAVTTLADRGVLCLRLQQLCPPTSPRVVVLFPLDLGKTLTSSHRSSGHSKRPCRTGGGGVIFDGSSGEAGEEV